MSSDKALIDRLQKLQHCDHCPTLKGAKEGWDAEMRDVLSDLETLEGYGPKVYCSWKQQDCVCYRVLFFETRKRLKEKIGVQ